MKIKARAVGNSIILTIPKEFNIAPGSEFEVEQHRDGSIVFVPKHRNPFEGNWFNDDLKQADVTIDTENLDNE